MITPSPKFKVTTAVCSLLLANEDIVNIVADRIFPIAAPKDTEGTFIIYQRDSYSAPITKMGAELDGCDVYVDVISNDYDESQDLAEKIYLTLFGNHTVNGKEITITLKDSTEDCDISETGRKYIQVLLFNIS